MITGIDREEVSPIYMHDSPDEEFDCSGQFSLVLQHWVAREASSRGLIWSTLLFLGELQTQPALLPDARCCWSAPGVGQVWTLS